LCSTHKYLNTVNSKIILKLLHETVWNSVFYSENLIKFGPEMTLVELFEKKEEYYM